MVLRKYNLLRPALLCVAVFLISSAAASTAKDSTEPVKYIGPGSCAATSCHGSVKPVDGSRILQNEYSTWILQDKHSRAYQALTGEVGERMARILQLGAKAEDSPKCLACHALYTTPEQRGRPFEISDGVSCESCHGPASAWLGPHTTRDWPHEKSVALGMRDTRNVIQRTNLCLECHLGTKDKFVDHEMIAAGHPDLYFELDSFSAVMPRHWKVPRESAPRKPVEDPAWSGVRDWATGQAVQLRASMDRLAWRANNQRADKKDIWLVTIRSAPPKTVGAKNTVTPAAPAIRPSTLHAMSCFVILPIRSIPPAHRISRVKCSPSPPK